MIRINQIKIKHDMEKSRSNAELMGVLEKNISKTLRIDKGNIKDLEIIRHSIDARKKPEIFDIYLVDVSIKGVDEKKVVNKCRDKNVSVIEPVRYDFAEQMAKICGSGIKGSDLVSEDSDDKIAIIGAGPAGLFCGYMLAKAGYKPLLIERGSDVDTRTEIVEHFWKTGELNVNTNVQFGEGGAGTFSDGKLNTMVKDKDGRGREALRIFVENGAPEDILYDAKPHIGTDILREVVKNMRNKIIEWGGCVLFDTLVSDVEIDGDGQLSAIHVIRKDEIPEDSLKELGIEVEPVDRARDNANENVCDNSDNTFAKYFEYIFNSKKAVLAIGHSARDTFYMLKDKAVSMEKKPFAVGFRVEHPQTIINLSQYGVAEPKTLPAAPYKLTTTTDSGRGVYSFCMCPGGYVVNASSEKGRLAVNGMSYSKRDGKNANSAIIVTVDPKDFGSDDVLSGVEFQRRLEAKAFEIGNGKIPVEYYGDFKAALAKCVSDSSNEKVSCNKDVNSIGNSKTDDLNNHLNPEEFKDISPNMRGEYVFANVHEILPDELNDCFVQGMEKFGRMIKGYNNDKALVSGVESRTSSPVRITRDETMQSVNVKGLYPCGEGAGYAGGIMSAAMDGMRVAEYIAACK